MPKRKSKKRSEADDAPTDGRDTAAMPSLSDAILSDIAETQSWEASERIFTNIFGLPGA